jgi:hypothetical protein
LERDFELSGDNAKILSRITEGRFGEAVRALREDRLGEIKGFSRYLPEIGSGYWDAVVPLLHLAKSSIERSEEAIKQRFSGTDRTEGTGSETESGDELKALCAGEIRRREEMLLKGLLVWYRDILVWRRTGNEHLLLGGAVEEIRRHARGMDDRSVEAALRCVENARRALRANVQFHNVMEGLFVELSGLQRARLQRGPGGAGVTTGR